MKIVFFMESYYCGGVDTFVINLINHWPNTADELILICNKTHSGLDNIKQALTRECHVVVNDVALFTSFFNQIRRLTKLDRVKLFLLKISSPILRYFFLAYNIIALRRIIFSFSPDRLLIVNGGYPAGDSCRAASICWGLFSRNPKSIHTFHGIVVPSSWHIRLQEYIVDIAVSCFTKAFVGVSKATAALMEHRDVIAKRSDILFIHSGIESIEKVPYVKAANIKQELGIPLSAPLCLMLGNYYINKNYDKGFSFLLNVFKYVLAEVPEAHLLTCGHGSPDDMDRVNAMVEKAGLKNSVHVCGFRGDIDSIFQQTDVFLVSAQAFEAFGLVSLEAMQRKIPVVATKVGGIPEVVLNDEGGYCIEKTDEQGYAKAVINLLCDERLRKEQGEKGANRYRQFFTADRMAEQYMKLLYED